MADRTAFADHVRARLVAARESLRGVGGREAAFGRRLCDIALTGSAEQLASAPPMPTADLGCDWTALLHTADSRFADHVTRRALDDGLAGEERERVALALEARLVNATRSHDARALAVLLRAALVARAGEPATIRQGLGRLSTMPPPGTADAEGAATLMQHAWTWAEAWRPGTTRAALRGRTTR